MYVATTIADLQQRLAAERAQGRRIAFVPTMGNLHAGHRHLMVEARRHAEVVVASIYVNPLQFGPNEDFGAYPRTPEEDRQLLAGAGVEVVFMPDEAQMYPRGRAAQTVVEVPGIGDILCGLHRPKHFRGVTTVVNRLFNLVSPDVALFGKKDYQQLLLIRLMTSDLGLPVAIVGVETVRDSHGLALSSRNAYLTEDERRRASHLHAALTTLGRQIQQAQRMPVGAEATALQALVESGFRPEYVSVRRQADLGEPGPSDQKLVILAAAWLGRARLIDNIELNLNPAV
jgi:pantoate--beta-alanine ligase